MHRILLSLRILHHLQACLPRLPIRGMHEYLPPPASTDDAGTVHKLAVKTATSSCKKSIKHEKMGYMSKKSTGVRSANKLLLLSVIVNGEDRSGINVKSVFDISP